MLRTALLTGLILGLSACGNSSDSPVSPSHEAQTDAAFVVSDARVRVPSPGRNVTAAYFSITSHLDDDAQITAVSADRAGVAELHTHNMTETGLMQMRQVMEVALPAGGAADFVPMGNHVMLFELEDGLAEGDTLTLSLTIQVNGTEETVSFEAPLGMQ